MHLGIVGPLPPEPCGAAEWLRVSLPLYEQHAEVTCFVPDPEKVDRQIRKAHRVRPVAEIADTAVDMVIYHVGNNPMHAFVFDTIMAGPPGLVEIHDGSLHHTLQERFLGKEYDPVRYVELGKEAHEYAGRRLAELRYTRFRGVVEMFLYDYLAPVLDRCLGAIVHSRYAKELVELRRPRLPTWLVPLHAPELPDPEPDRAWTGIGEGTLLVAHVGVLTLPKRPRLYLEAVHRVLEQGLDVHFVVVGKDDSKGLVRREIRRLGLSDHVTVTGYLDTKDLERWIQAVDVIVNLRAPHVGESSGSLAYGLSAGKPVIVQPVGAWAEFPPDVVVRLPVTDDDVEPLSRTLFALGQDASLRQRYGTRAREYAVENLGAHDIAERLVRAASQAKEHSAFPAAWSVPGRLAAVDTFLAAGPARITSLVADDGPEEMDGQVHAVLSCVPAAIAGERLLAIDVPPSLVQLLATLWGYQVDARTWSNDGSRQYCDAHIGVPSYEYSQTPLDDELFDSAHWNVIVALSPGDVEWFMRRCNQGLVPQGLMTLLGSEVDASAMDRCGFSLRVHRDRLRVPPLEGDQPSGVTIGVKATLAEGLLQAPL